MGAIAHGGHCVARHEGRVVFVRHAIPGERVIAEITDDRGGSYCRADAVEIVRASPDRVAPPCSYAGPGGCGGCDFQHISGPRQQGLKAEVVRDQLLRLGKLSAAEVDGLNIAVRPLTPPGDGLGWRTRVQFTADGQGRLGFRRHRSHQVVAVESCAIADTRINDAQLMTQLWQPGSDVEVAVSSTDQIGVLSAAPSGDAHSPRGARKHVAVAGARRLTEVAIGRRWRVHAGGFWQVHPLAAATFATTVMEFLRPQPGETAFDLYSGVGLFAGALAEPVGETGSVIAVEADKAAHADARRNVGDLPWVHLHEGKVDHVLTKLPLEPVDLVVLDPPRAGAGKAVVDHIVARSPRAIAYVACDPAALARDVAFFRERSYRLSALRALDAFPMTHHVECVALLERRE